MSNFPENEIVPKLVLFFKKVFYEVEASDQHLSINIFWCSSIWIYNKSTKYMTLKSLTVNLEI